MDLVVRSKKAAPALIDFDSPTAYKRSQIDVCIENSAVKVWIRKVTDLGAANPEDDKLAEVLTSAVAEGGDARRAATAFYNAWFQRHGKSYCFIFKKNLGITNLQYAEFIALLKRHIVAGLPQDRAPQPTFADADEVKHVFANLVEDFFSEDGTWKPERVTLERIAAMCANYGDMLRNIIVLNPYFGSATIYLSPRIDIDVRAICAESGYIHSCGRLIYVRNMAKASISELHMALNRHLSAFCQNLGFPVFFRTYSHEDSTNGTAIQRVEQTNLSLTILTSAMGWMTLRFLRARAILGKRVWLMQSDSLRASSMVGSSLPSRGTIKLPWRHT